MTVNKAAPDLQEIALLGRLPCRRRNHLVSNLIRVEFPAGSRIIDPGQNGDFLGIVGAGELQEKLEEEQRVLIRGDTFGSSMLLQGKPSQTTVTAVSDSAVWILRRSVWLSPNPGTPSRVLPDQTPQRSRLNYGLLAIPIVLIMFLGVLGPTLLESATKILPETLLETGRADLAESYLNFVKRLRPGSAQVQARIGDLYALQDLDQQAVDAYQVALEIDEYQPAVHNNLGVILLKEGEIDQAVYHFRMAASLNPLQAEPFRNLGNAYYSLELWEEAAGIYQQALDLDANLLDSKAAWAGINLSENNLTAARQAWEEVLQEDPRSALALEGLGVVALLNDQPEQALNYLQAALFLDEDDPGTHLYLGLTLEEMERSGEAEDAYQYVINNSQDPEMIRLAESLLEVLQE